MQPHWTSLAGGNAAVFTMLSHVLHPGLSSPSLPWGRSDCGAGPCPVKTPGERCLLALGETELWNSSHLISLSSDLRWRKSRSISLCSTCEPGPTLRQTHTSYLAVHMVPEQKCSNSPIRQLCLYHQGESLHETSDLPSSLTLGHRAGADVLILTLWPLCPLAARKGLKGACTGGVGDGTD